MLALVFGLAVSAPMRVPGSCYPGSDTLLYVDMHDGDEKTVAVTGELLDIRPIGNKETWEIKADLKEDDPACQAMVDFDVKGKPNPPPCSLLATQYALTDNTGLAGKLAWEYTDPTDACKFGNPGLPLNEWIGYPAVKLSRPQTPFVCADRQSVFTFKDMSDGDEKKVAISANDVVTITPTGNNQTWKVQAKLDTATCSAVIDFSVPGKPNPPPCKLTMKLWQMVGIGGPIKHSWEFTDPTDACKFGEPGSPLNHWVQLQL